MRRFLNPVLAALAVVSVAGPAIAGTVWVDVPVAYGDLDLSRPEQVTILKSRLQHAASFACTTSQTRQATALAPETDAEQCTKDAYDRALAVLSKRVPQQVALRD